MEVLVDKHALTSPARGDEPGIKHAVGVWPQTTGEAKQTILIAAVFGESDEAMYPIAIPVADGEPP